jgi:hypothetical protein
MAVIITITIGAMKRTTTFEDEAAATAVLLAYSELQGVPVDAQPGAKLQAVVDGVVHHIRQDARAYRRQQALEAAIAASRTDEIDFSVVIP